MRRPLTYDLIFRVILLATALFLYLIVKKAGP